MPFRPAIWQFLAPITSVVRHSWRAQSGSWLPCLDPGLFKHSAYTLFLLRETRPTDSRQGNVSTEGARGERKSDEGRGSAKQPKTPWRNRAQSSELDTRHSGRSFRCFFPYLRWRQKLTTSFQLAVTSEISLGLNMQTSKWYGMEIGHRRGRATDQARGNGVEGIQQPKKMHKYIRVGSREDGSLGWRKGNGFPPFPANSVLLMYPTYVLNFECTPSGWIH